MQIVNVFFFQQKHKSKGNVRTVTKTVKNDSFFNFFDPPAIPDDPEAEVDAETQELLTADFELGHYIRERIVPRAVLYFTGKLLSRKIGPKARACLQS
jgi:nucleosome assembly protein 1-like 1